METINEPGSYSPDDRYGLPKYAGQTMTKAKFLRWESDDNYVYEYNKGILEPTTSIRQEESYLLGNVEDRFFKTASFQNGDRLRAEIDVWLQEKQMRRPDVVLLHGESIEPDRYRGAGSTFVRG